MKHSILSPLAAVALASVALSQSYTETFEAGVNAGGWTWGNPADSLVGGGNPGMHLRNNNLDTFAPQLRTTTATSDFTSDWRANGVTSFSMDLRTYATQFNFQREATLMLSSGGCQVYYLGTEFVPQVAEGWKSISYPVDSQSATLPAGWTVLNGCGSDDDTWNAVITNVTEVRIFYGDPTFFFIFDIWQVGVDNLAVEAGSSNYCTALANSTGSPATISTSGSTSVGANDLVLSASPLPANQFGIFFYGPGQQQTPFGNGFLCVEGVIQRLDVENSGPSGTLVHALDNTSPPTAAGQITAGSTWNFQGWYRDPAAGGANFNLSDGTARTFTP